MAGKKWTSSYGAAARKARRQARRAAAEIAVARARGAMKR